MNETGGQGLGEWQAQKHCITVRQDRRKERIHFYQSSWDMEQAARQNQTGVLQEGAQKLIMA